MIGRVEFVEANAVNYPFPERRFDVVVAAFFLDCFDETAVQRLLPRVLDSVAEGGSFYYVDFVVPPGKVSAVYAKLMLAVMHRFFAWQTGLSNSSLVDVPTRFRRLNWVVSHQLDQHFGMITARIYRRRRQQRSC